MVRRNDETTLAKSFPGRVRTNGIRYCGRRSGEDGTIDGLSPQTPRSGIQQAWDEALDVAADTLEDEARKRAFAGSDVLLMFLLKGIRPQKWRESRATIPPAELNKMIETELKRLAEAKAQEASETVN